jgi:hypothetical protein
MRLVGSHWTHVEEQRILCILIAQLFIVQGLGEHDVVNSPGHDPNPG